MTSCSRGLRVLKSFEWFRKTKPHHFGNSLVLEKLNITSLCNGTLQGFFKVDSSMCNSIDTIHGGYVASVIDIVSFVAHLSNAKGRGSFTTSMFVNYFTTARIGDEVTVNTNTTKLGQLSVMETCLTNSRGDLIAKGIASFAAGKDDQQKLMKRCLNFDVYEE